MQATSGLHAVQVTIEYNVVILRSRQNCRYRTTAVQLHQKLDFFVYGASFAIDRERSCIRYAIAVPLKMLKAIQDGNLLRCLMKWG